MTTLTIIQNECFVDASDDLPALQDGRLGEDGAEEAAIKAVADEAERSGNLKIRLDETTEILRLALSNEFIKALEACEDR